MSVSGALFDMNKLVDVSKDRISVMPAQQVLDLLLDWSRNNDLQLYELLQNDTDYARNILNIDREKKKPRKDIAKWSDVKDYMAYFYDELWDKIVSKGATSSDVTTYISNNYTDAYSNVNAFFNNTFEFPVRQNISLDFIIQ